MPFPPKIVFLKFLDLYDQYKLWEENQSTLSRLLGSAKSALGSIAGSNQAEIQTQLSIIRSTIESADTFKNWFNLVPLIRQTAAKCQELKSLSGSSNSSLVLHGLASLIISELKASDEYRKSFEAEITRLKQEAATKQTVFYESARDDNGVNFELLMRQLHEITEKLAELSDLEYIAKARLYNLFQGSLVRRDIGDLIKFTNGRGNQMNLIELQPNFHEWLYLHLYQIHLTHVDLNKFKTNAIQEHYEQEKARRTLTANSAAAAAASAAIKTDSQRLSDTVKAQSSLATSNYHDDDPNDSAKTAAAATTTRSISPLRTLSLLSPPADTSTSDTSPGEAHQRKVATARHNKK